MDSSHAKVPAWNVLIAQPSSLATLTDSQRADLVISAVVLADGTELVVSRFGDLIWKLDAYIHGPGAHDAQKYIEWPTDCAQMVNALKSACWAWKHLGRNELAPPKWQSIRVTAVLGLAFIRWLRDHGIESFDAVRPLHLANYVHHCKNELQLEPAGLRHRLGAVELLWRFRSEVPNGLNFQPWGGHSVTHVAGIRFRFESAKTPVIPRPIQEQLYAYCVGVLERAEIDIPPGHAIDPPALMAPNILNVRDAMLYLVSITTGMRSDEVLGIEVGAYREETVGGVLYRWVRAVENKTGKGEVEYLCPAITGRALRVLEKWAAPYHALLRREIEALLQEPSSAARELRLLKANADLKRVLLSVLPRKGWRVGCLSSGAAHDSMRRAAKCAGVDWELNPHQTRRTYARMIVESKMGRASLIFLKWQLKHTSMTMTQGYASNPIADRSLVEDFLDEMILYRGELLDSWTSDTPLSGGAGRSIIELRATPHANREALLKSASEHVHIRATGHGWCLAEMPGCGGAGLYEATRCVNCRDGVIDPSFAQTWLEIHEQQRELLDLDDAGPAVRTRAQREVRLSAKVLADLGLEMPT